MLVLWGVVTVVFLLFNVLPGDPARMMLGQRADGASIEAINRDLGRDKPLFQQYLMYVNDLSPISFHDTDHPDNFLFLHADKYESFSELIHMGSKVIVFKTPYLRRSYQTKRRVSEVLMDALPGTTVLAVTAILFATFFGVILGIISAVRSHTLYDNMSLVLSVLGMSLPSFFSGIIIAWLFGYVWSDTTGLNMTGSLYTLDPFQGEILDLKNLILPALTLGIRPLAIITQLTRSSLLDVLSQDYIRTASAKGLSYYKVITRHALKNAMNPVMTAVSGWFASLMAGAIFVEIIFGWKGLGKEIVDSLDKYDFPVVMGCVLVVAVTFVIINMVVDILYGILDPRVRVR
ncbi:MAG: ABC transporter permease [Flavobacteriales bacterium]|nr:ABC transporter permease [Flavobacteriales bacterium]